VRLVAALELLNHVVAVLRCHGWQHIDGWSGHARFNIPDVPGLRDHSAIVVGDRDELDSAVVICLCNPHGIQVLIGAMLASCASYYHITYVARMWLLLSVFMLIVLNDKPLLLFFDELLICLERGIQHCVTAEHQLCRRWACSGMRCRIHSFPTCCQNTLKSKKRI